MKDKTNANAIYDVIIIGGGQSALACGYFLRRTGLRYLILDDQTQAGGAWQNGWESLTLFSPSAYSSLPGWMMPEAEGRFPTRNETIITWKTMRKNMIFSLKDLLKSKV